MYGAPIWGQARPSNIKRIQVFQNKILRQITGTPLFTKVKDMHTYSGIKSVTESIREAAINHSARLENHDNALAIELLDNSLSVRRLRRNHFHDMI